MESKCEYSSIQIPNDPKYARAAAMYISEIARAIGMETQDIESLENGIIEAITAVMNYSFESAEKGTLAILCERVPEGLKVSLRDKGLPFGVVGAESAHAENSTSEPFGLTGVVFRLKEYLDEIQLNNLGPEGKELVLIKHLKNKSITDYYDACELEPYEVPPPPVADAPAELKCRVRQMKPADAPEVSKTIYKTYGYTYPHDYVYYPEKIIALNESGRVYSAVAIAGDKEIAGYGVFQIWEENPQIVEMAQGAVKPKFRSMGCFRTISQYLLDQAKSRGIKAAFGEAVTNHTISQHTIHGFGFKDCGLRLGLIPPDTDFKGISGSVPHRVSMLVQFLYLQPPSVPYPKIYAPPHHKDIIADLYKELGVAAAVNTDTPAAVKPQSATSEFKIALVGSMRYARIIVGRYGPDMAEALKYEVRQLGLKKIEIVNLFLNLSDPLTASATAQFEKMGFFFAGILPYGFKDGDALILQYLNNVAIAYDAIQVKSGIAQKLLVYVRDHDPNVS